MSINQQDHGGFAEDLTKLSGLFPGAEALVGKNHLRHDIPVDFDPSGAFNTGVKALSDESDTIYLADARRLREDINRGGMRLVVWRHDQIGDFKCFHSVFEFVLSRGMMRTLYGAVSKREIEAVSEMITLQRIPRETEDASGFAAGKQEAEACVNWLQEKTGLVRFHPKIGSDTERRLQCSINIDEIWDRVRNRPTSRLYQDRYGDIALPQQLYSSRRVNAGPRPVSAASFAPVLIAAE